MDNIFVLHNELMDKTYKHGPYIAFKINDPKPRDIHKASVGDRIVHHAIYRILYPYFDRKFISDSYSCRVDKGIHRAVNRFRILARKASKNDTKTVWILKCDIKKFFASIDHLILRNELENHIADINTLWLLEQIIDSFHNKDRPGFGLPLGNLTSQLFINIYMNEFDGYVKRNLKVRYYIRYADDFVIFSQDKEYLLGLIPRISEFLEVKLSLLLNPSKLSIKTLSSGVDFLGWVNFPHHRILRTTTKKRMFRKLGRNRTEVNFNSYLGLLKHGNTYKLARKIGAGMV